MDDARRIAPEAVLEIDETAPKELRGVLSPEDVIHFDDDVMVVRKAAGVLSVPYEDGDKDTLIDRARARLARMLRERGADVSLGAVQRLDKDTTGLLVFSRNLRAKAALEEQLRAHSVVRRYLAIAHGVVREARHETMLVQDRGDGLRGSTEHAHQGKRAVTHVEVVERLRGATVCRIRLETGKTHQIRIHLAERGHPLIGEEVYLRDFTFHGGVLMGAPRMMLHAETLGFIHPLTGERLRFASALPAAITAWIAEHR